MIKPTSNLLLPVHERGPWLATASGGFWSIEDPHPEDVCLDDIIIGLSRVCRYAGQINPLLEFYSVAEHSVLMTEWAIENGKVRTRADALKILFHDASEAYFGDMPTPLKALVPQFKALETHAQTVIENALGLSACTDLITKAEIKSIDTRIRLDERALVIQEPAFSIGMSEIWKDDPELKPLGVQLECLTPREAVDRFMDLLERVNEIFPDPSNTIEDDIFLENTL